MCRTMSGYKTPQNDVAAVAVVVAWGSGEIEESSRVVAVAVVVSSCSSGWTGGDGKDIVSLASSKVSSKMESKSATLSLPASEDCTEK